MKILDNMFKWFTAKDKDGKEMNLGYVLDGEPTSIQDIEKVFKAFQLDKYFEAIKPLVRPKIDITLSPIDESIFNSPKSKIGGHPHLMIDQEWPKNELGNPYHLSGS